MPSVVYYGGFKLPDEKARGVHAILSCVSLARAGVPVTMLVRAAPGRGPTDVTAEALVPYDTEVPEGLEIVDAGRGRFGRFLGRSAGLRLETLAALGRRPRGRNVFYTMDYPGLRVMPRLLRWRAVLGFRMVFELHNLTSTVLQEEAERRHDDRVRFAQLVRRAAEAERVERRSYRRLDGVVANSRGTLEAARAAFGVPKHALVLPNGVDPDRFSTEALESAGRAVGGKMGEVDAIYTGSFDGWKGVETLVDAIGSLPSARLRLVGFGDEQVRAGIRDRIRSRAVEDRVELLGYRPHREIPSLLATSRVVVVTTSANSREGREFTCPMKLLEAMAAGRPIVASDLPSIRELVTDGEHALLFRPDDPEDLARAIGRLLDDRALAQRLGAAARRRARDYSWSRRAERLKTFLEDIVTPGAASQRAP